MNTEMFSIDTKGVNEIEYFDIWKSLNHENALQYYKT